MSYKSKYLLVLLGVTAALAALMWYRLSGSIRWDAILFAWLIAINVVAFCCYGLDKLFAKRGSSRIPERALFGLTLAGGTPAAYVAMKTFRHKTVKLDFQSTFAWIIVIQAIVFIWMICRWLF